MSVDMSHPSPPRQSLDRMDRLVQNPGDLVAIYQLWQSSQDQQDVDAVRSIWDYCNIKARPAYLNQQYKPLNDFTYFNGTDSKNSLARINTPQPTPYAVLAPQVGNYPTHNLWWRGSSS